MNKKLTYSLIFVGGLVSGITIYKKSKPTRVKANGLLEKCIHTGITAFNTELSDGIYEVLFGVKPKGRDNSGAGYESLIDENLIEAMENNGATNDELCSIYCIKSGAKRYGKLTQTDKAAIAYYSNKYMHRKGD